MGTGDLKLITERTSFRERNFDPTLRRDPSHAPEEGLGGAAHWVNYHAKDLIGIVHSTWNHRDGEHWEAVHVPSWRTLSSDGEYPQPYENRADAVNALLREHNIEPDWAPTDRSIRL